MNDSKVSEFASQTRRLRRARLPLFLVLLLNVGLVVRIPLTQASVESAASDSESLAVMSADPHEDQTNDSPSGDADIGELSPEEMERLDQNDEQTVAENLDNETQPQGSSEEPVDANTTGVDEEATGDAGMSNLAETSPSEVPTASGPTNDQAEKNSQASQNSPERGGATDSSSLLTSPTNSTAKTPKPEKPATKSPANKTPATQSQTSPLEQPTEHIILRNPTSFAVFFVIDRKKTVALFPAQEREIDCRDKRLIEFHRGDDHGDAAFRLRPGRYDFTLSKDRGWDLISRPRKGA